METVKFGIITVSDSCHKREKLDSSGPKLVSLINDAYSNSSLLCTVIVPDDIPMIKDTIVHLCDRGCNVIFTTGGTGFSPRDVTPEATKAVINRETPGITCAMMVKSLAITKYAMLSRAVCGIRDKTLIVNLPGSTKAVTEHFDVIKDIIPHAVALIKDDQQAIHDMHHSLQKEGKCRSASQKKFSPSKVKLNAVANRNRTSPYKMIEVSEAHAIIRSVCLRESDNETIDMKEALGRILAEDVSSLNALPPYPSSIKDGYAVRSVDGAGKRLVLDGIAAGDAPLNCEIQEGECMRISTGAPVPPGADAVVQVEDTELLLASLDHTKEIEVEINVSPTAGQDIRAIGSDIEAHSVIMKKGIVLNAAEIGVLATVRKTSVKVYKRPIVGIISTGNELQNPYDELQHGCIQDSNKITILSILKQYGYDSKDFGLAKDTPDAVKEKLQRAFLECNMIVTTGSVSMGEYDVIKRVLEEDFDAKIHFGRVNMKPGKPTTFATCMYDGQIKTVFGLPGNPVSATVTCLLFVIYTLRHCENRQQLLFPLVSVETQFTPKLDPERPEYHRVKLSYEDSGIKAYSTGNQISSRLNSFVGADGLLILPALKKSEEFLETETACIQDASSSCSSHQIKKRHKSCPVTSCQEYSENQKLQYESNNSSFTFKPRETVKYSCYLLDRY